MYIDESIIIKIILFYHSISFYSSCGARAGIGSVLNSGCLDSPAVLPTRPRVHHPRHPRLGTEPRVGIEKVILFSHFHRVFIGCLKLENGLFVAAGDRGAHTAFIDENLNYGFVGELATIDEDINQTHSYSLINNGGWKFILRQKEIFSSFHANLDYETKSEYFITVRSSDNGSPRLSIDKTFTIQVSGSVLVMIRQRIG